MFSYIRTWWLINRLAKQLIVLNAMNRGLLALQATPQAHRVLTLLLEEFLEERAHKYWFGILLLRKGKYTDLRKEKDANLLRRANNLNLIQIAPESSTSSRLVIHMLPDGYYFSKIMNGLSGFLKEYKEAFVTIIAVLLSPYLWNLIQAVYHFVTRS